MSLSRGTVAGKLGDFIVDQAAANATYSLVKGSSTVVYSAYVDNTSNTHAVYLKLYNHATPTVGSTIPAFLVKVQASAKFTMFWPVGPTLGNACTFACVQEPGTAGTTSPVNNTRVIVVAT
tara:strand:- start:407 stop:769 length:363 start_codon:yes stop_codon:yes gene_type:complete